MSSLINSNGIFTVNELFSDHAVLQRDIPIPVWGTAETGDKIICRLDKTEAYTTADEDKRFLLRLPPQNAGGPFILEVKNLTTGNVITAEDVYIGEVWLACGQSNMEWTINKLPDDVQNVALNDDIPSEIRMLNMPNKRWLVADLENVPVFSATAYFFACELRRKLRVAVGILNSSVGGSIAEAWASRDVLLRNKNYAEAFKEYEKVVYTSEWQRKKDEFYASRHNMISCYNDNKGLSDGWAKIDYDDSSWDTISLPVQWNKAGYDYNGIMWFRNTIEVSVESAGKDLELNIGAIDKCDETYFNGEKVGQTGHGLDHTAYAKMRKYVVPGRLVKAGKNAIAVRAFSFWADSGMTGPADKMFVDGISLSGNWKCRSEVNFGKQIYGTINYTYAMDDFASLFDGMIKPLIPYAIKGCIWYQGESNVDRGFMFGPTVPGMNKKIEYYEDLMVALINDWRHKWGVGDFPFLQVQLAGFGKTSEYQETPWADMRIIQSRIAERTDNLMATAIDIGEPSNIHPRYKKEIGARLSLCALKQAYGENINPMGPVLKSVVKEKGKVRITFDNADMLYAGGDAKAKGFALAGSDGKYHLADEAEVSGDSVVISSRKVAKPVSIRYGWAEFPVINLYNKEGLPAFPFQAELKNIPGEKL